jgi:hypothetical protein
MGHAKFERPTRSLDRVMIVLNFIFSPYDL